MRSKVWVTVALLLAAGGCDNDAGKKAESASAAAATATPSPSASSAAPVPEPPAPPRVPTITVDDHTCSIDGKTFTGDWVPDATRFLHGFGPELAGKDVAVNAMRDTKVPKVQAIVAALAGERVRGVAIRTPMRDQSSGELPLALSAKAPACTVVAMIEQNGAVAVWSKGGGGAQRFSRGMAGPDLSSSTDALRKRAAACDSPAWYFSAADTVTWGLAFDLAMRARAGAEAGAALKPTQTVLLTEAPVPGRAVRD